MTIDELTERLRVVVVPGTGEGELHKLAEVMLAEYKSLQPKPLRGRRRLPDDEVRRSTAMNRKRRTAKLIEFIESIDCPLSSEHRGETKREARARVLEDILKRCKLAHQAGLPTIFHATMRFHWFQQDIEKILSDARRDVRIERRYPGIRG
jgi:hypothetical protein